MKHFSRLKVFTIVSVFLWLGLFALLPTLGLFITTFLMPGETEFFSLNFTFDNYIELFDPSFLCILWNSIWLAFMGTCVCLFIGYPFAYRVARSSTKIKPWLLFLIIIPFWTNSLIRTYALILLLKADGLISKSLLLLGITHEPVSFLYGDFAIFMGITYTFLPFMVLPLYTIIEQIDPKLLDAAKDLGADSLKVFWHVTLPLTLPGIVTGSMFVFLPSLGAFYIPEVLGGSKSMLVGSFIKNQFLVTYDWPLGAAASMVLTVILFALLSIHHLTVRTVFIKNRWEHKEKSSLELIA